MIDKSTHEYRVHTNSYDLELWMRRIGEATTILLNSPRKKVSIASIGAFILPFARMGQIRVFHGSNRYPAAYITWAYLTDASLEEVARDPSMVLEEEALNAGDNLVILDALSNLRDIRPIVAFIRSIIPQGATRFYGVRFDKSAKVLRLREYVVRSGLPRFSE